MLYPGFKSEFDKNLFKKVTEEINNRIPDIVIKSFKCQLYDNFVTIKEPDNCKPSDYNDANKIVIEKNGRIILETYKQRLNVNLGLIDIYEQNLSKNELKILYEIFKKYKFGKPRPVSHKNYHKIIWIFLGIGVIYTAFIYFNRDYFFSLNFWPNVLILAPPLMLVILAFLVPSYFAKKEIKKERKRQ